MKESGKVVVRASLLLSLDLFENIYPGAIAMQDSQKKAVTTKQSTHSAHLLPQSSRLHRNCRRTRLIIRLVDNRSPRMVQHSLNANPPLNVSIKHLPNQVNAILTHHIWYPEVMIHDLVYTIERVLFVHNRVEEDAECPYILLFPSVW